MKIRQNRFENLLYEKYSFIKWIFLGLFIASILTHFFLSLESADKSAVLSGSVTEEVVKIIEDVTNTELDHDVAHSVIRKLIGHYGWFGLIGIFGFLTFRSFLNKKFYFSLILCLISGALIATISELLQVIPSGRDANFKDIMIDYSGYITAMLICFIIALIYYRNNNQKNNIN